MKKLLIVLLLAASTGAFAQGLAVGIRGGINNGTLSTKIPNIKEGTIKNGLLLGAFGRVSLLGFFVQPEINYSTRVGRFEQVGVGVYTNSLSYLDVNAMLGYSLVGVVRVNFGPTLMTLLSASQEAESVMKDNSFSKDYFNSTAWGFQIGAGIDLGKLTVDLRYDMNLTNLGKTNVNSTRFGNPTDYSTGFGMYQFTLGYKIIKI